MIIFNNKGNPYFLKVQICALAGGHKIPVKDVQPEGEWFFRGLLSDFLTRRNSIAKYYFWLNLKYFLIKLLSEHVLPLNFNEIDQNITYQGTESNSDDEILSIISIS